MPNLAFIGRVLPETLKISLTVPPISVSNPKNRFECTIQVVINNCAIKVDIQANRFEEADFQLLHRRVLHATNAAVDMLSFTSGFGLRVILDTFIDADGRLLPIRPQQSSLAECCKSYGARPGDEAAFGRMYSKIATTPHLFLALHDVVAGLHDYEEGPIVLARAVETIRRLFAPDDSEPSEQWKRMRAALRLTQAYLMPITLLSQGPRHGARTGALEHDLSEAAKRTWIVMDRCLEYFKRSAGPLPESEFPML